MKHKSHIPRLLKGVMLGAITLSASLAGANDFMPQKSADLLQREQEAFLNPNVKTIPFESKSTFKEGKPRKLESGIQTQPITTNPVLMQKAMADAQKESGNAAADLVEKFRTNLSWGSFTNVNDNKLYYFTQENVPSGIPNGVIGQYYKAAKFKIYNDNFEELKSFEVNSIDTVMSFTLSAAVSSKVFNNTDDWEFMVQMHGFSKIDGGGPINCRDTLFIVNENSEVIRKIGSISTVMLNKYDSFRYHLSLYQPQYTGIQDKVELSIYDPKAIGAVGTEMPEALYHYEKANNLLSYSNGPSFEMMDIEGTQYYISTYYEKPFMADNDIENPVVEKNNNFIVDIYDTKFQLVKSIKLPLIGQDKNEYSMSDLRNGFYGYQISKHIFNDDDNFEIVYGMSRYYPEIDAEKVDYYLMNENGEVLKEMIKETGGTIKLMDIPGQSDEYAVLIGGGDAITDITMYKMPEMETVFNFPARHNNELLSLSFDRTPAGDSYEYVFGLGSGEMIGDKLYGVVANYNTKGENTKRFRIELSNDVARFSTVVQGNMLNPYSIIADDQREFVYFVTKASPDGDYSSMFGIANENETVYSWEDDLANDYMQSGAGVLIDESRSHLKYLYVTGQNTAGNEMTYRFYPLPLNQPTLKGEGTKSNPYLITSPAELELVRQNLKACYALDCDLDMRVVLGVDGTGFLPIDNFEGEFDGRGHTIKNLALTTNNYCLGLFGNISGGTVKNLRIENITFNNIENATYGTGAIAATLTNAHIDNCHASFNLTSTAQVQSLGGLVGTVSINSTIANSSYNGTINTPNAEDIGGIAGVLRTNSIISNCYSAGSIYGLRACAGITSNIAMTTTVTNCYSTMDIKSTSWAGGIASNGNGIVTNNYTTGKVESDFREGERWKNKAGGILSDINKGMMGEAKVEGNVALNPYILMETDFYRIAGTIYDEATGNNDILKNNYALATMKIGSSEETLATVDESDEITVGLDRIHGKSVTEDELTQEFFENLGWKFGNDSINPWRMEGKYPSLWFEYRVQGVKLDYNKFMMGVGQKYTINATIIPEKAENKKVRYSSSDMRVAIVDANGEITARAKGTAVITVTSEDGNYTDHCTVTVINAIESITLDKTELMLYIRDGIELTPTINPEDADNTELIWTSSNPEVATVDKGVVRAIAAGEAEITVKAAVGDASATCKVTVFPEIEDFYFETSSVSLNKENPTQQLHVTIMPKEAQNVPLRWESDNEAVATVDAEGLVSAVGDGDAIITAMTTDRLHKADCLVMVTDFGSGIDEVANKAMIIVTDNALTISSDLNISRVMGVDIAGVTVFDNAVNGNQTTVMTSALQPGAYIVKVLYENGNTTTHKIIIK